jgi:DNA-binding transcriptional MocR family regulator
MAAAPPDLVARWKLVGKALHEAGMSAAYVAVLWSILDRMNDAGECWPSLSRIAEDAGVDRRTASRAIEALSSSGLLRVQSGSRTSTNVYRLGTGESANKCAGDSAHTCTGESENLPLPASLPLAAK